MATTYTWHACTSPITNLNTSIVGGGANRSCLSLFNNSATIVARVYRMWRWMCWTTASAPSDQLSTFFIRRITSSTTVAYGNNTGTNVFSAFTWRVYPTRQTPGAPFPSSIDLLTNSLVNATDTFRRMVLPSGAARVTQAILANWTVELTFAEVWNVGYDNQGVEPLVCRTSEGVDMAMGSGTQQSAASYEMEFTTT